MRSVCQPGQNTRKKTKRRERILSALSVNRSVARCFANGKSSPNRTLFEMDGLGNSTGHEKSVVDVGPLVQNVTIIRSLTIRSK